MRSVRGGLRVVDEDRGLGHHLGGDEHLVLGLGGEARLDDQVLVLRRRGRLRQDRHRLLEPGRLFAHRLGRDARHGRRGGPWPHGPQRHGLDLGRGRRGGGRRRRVGRRAHGVRGRGLDGTARQDALQHHHVVLARRPEPEDVAVAQDGASGLERVVVDVQRARGAGVVGRHAAGFHHDAGVVRAHRRKVEAQGRSRAPSRSSRCRSPGERTACPRAGPPARSKRPSSSPPSHPRGPVWREDGRLLEPRHSRRPPRPASRESGAPGHATAARPRGRRARSRSRRWPGSGR